MKVIPTLRRIRRLTRGDHFACAQTGDENHNACTKSSHLSRVHLLHNAEGSHHSHLRDEAVQAVASWSMICIADRPFGFAVDRADTTTNISARTLVDVHGSIPVRGVASTWSSSSAYRCSVKETSSTLQVVWIPRGAPKSVVGRRAPKSSSTSITHQSFIVGGGDELRCGTQHTQYSLFR